VEARMSDYGSEDERSTTASESDFERLAGTDAELLQKINSFSPKAFSEGSLSSAEISEPFRAACEIIARNSGFEKGYGRRDDITDDGITKESDVKTQGLMFRKATPETKVFSATAPDTKDLVAQAKAMYTGAKDDIDEFFSYAEFWLDTCSIKDTDKLLNSLQEKCAKLDKGGLGEEAQRMTSNQAIILKSRLVCLGMSEESQRAEVPYLQKNGTLDEPSWAGKQSESKDQLLPPVTLPSTRNAYRHKR
jgi:hypothetical protein